MRLTDDKYLELLWRDPVARTNAFFDRSPFHNFKGSRIDAYQLGVYLSMWGELYGFREDPRVIAATGRGTGKTTTFQELNAADMAVFMPYFLQMYYGTDKPIDVTIIFVANVKKGSRQRLENVKNIITANPMLERQLIDRESWTKERVQLRNGTLLVAETASDRTRGYHSQHPKGKVIYLCDEFAFWGGTQCMDGQKFVEEVADQSFGSAIGCFTTPYGKRGGAWWAFNHPNWLSVNFPTWANPRVDRKKLAVKVKRLLDMGREIIVEQEIRGNFVEDAGLFFTMEIWMKSLNASAEWDFDNQSDYRSIMKQLRVMAENREKRKGIYLLGIDPNKGTRNAGSDPYGVNLVQKVGRKYFSRLASAYNGRTQEEMAEMQKLLFRIYDIKKCTFDGGGGYCTGPMAMIKGQPGTENCSIKDIPGSGKSIVGYMSVLRSLMEMGRYEQPPDEDLRESQMAMKAIGERLDESDEAMIRFQTDKKKFGIPCDLAAMGLSISRENVTTVATTLTSEKGVSGAMDRKLIEGRKLTSGLRGIGDMGLKGIHSSLTGVGH